jgi:hypothetical protein
MKKLLLLLVVFIIGSAGAFAFDILSYPPPLEGGDILADVGVGYAGIEVGDLTIPPLRVSAEYALPVGVPISVGALFSYHGSESEVVNETYGFTFLTFGVRGNWHWAFNVDWLDVYTGVFIGYQHVIYTGHADVEYGGFTPGGQAGVHFYFSKIFGAFVEVGAPVYVSAGLSLKF